MIFGASFLVSACLNWNTSVRSFILLYLTTKFADALQYNKQNYRIFLRNEIQLLLYLATMTSTNHSIVTQAEGTSWSFLWVPLLSSAKGTVKVAWPRNLGRLATPTAL